MRRRSCRTGSGAGGLPPCGAGRRSILEYAGKKNTDGDIAYYMENLHSHTCAANSIWNARRALADMMAPVVRRIIDELGRAPYLMVDETPYPYKKGTAYVWVVRTGTASLVVPAAGRAGANAPEFLKELRHMPVVDGYAVYYRLFDVIQRCRSHMLLKAEEVHIRCKEPARKAAYVKLYHRLCSIHRWAKDIAGATPYPGGADARTCLDLERGVSLAGCALRRAVRVVVPGGLWHSGGGGAQNPPRAPGGEGRLCPRRKSPVVDVLHHFFGQPEGGAKGALSRPPSQLGRRNAPGRTVSGGP